MCVCTYVRTCNVRKYLRTCVNMCSCSAVGTVCIVVRFLQNAYMHTYNIVLIMAGSGLSSLVDYTQMLCMELGKYAK